MKKKSLSLVLFLLTVLIGQQAYANEDITFKVDGIRYQTFYWLSHDYVYVIRSDDSGGYSGNIVIPSKVTYDSKEYTVYGVDYKAFYGCRNLISVDLSNINWIGQSYVLFGDCTNLEVVVLPNSMKFIANSMFYGCKRLTSIIIPNSVTYIEAKAFEGCSSLSSITIPQSVTTIEQDAFKGCCGLTSIKVEEGNEYYDSRDNCNALIKSKTNALIQGCNSTIIPNTVDSIYNFAFSGCEGIMTLKIPNSVKSIGRSAFSGCSNLTSINIPNSLQSIENGTFTDCSSLTSITIPSSVTSIGELAFQNCSNLTSVNIPNSVTSIETSAFYNCTSISSMIIPSSVKSIGQSAFAHCNFSSLFLNAPFPNKHYYDDRGVQKQENNSNVFSRSIIKNLIIGEDVQSINYKTFSGCSIGSIIVENGNKVYDSRDNCNAIIQTSTNHLIIGSNSSTIPNSVISIGEYAFSDRTGLTSISIPNTIKSIEDYTFLNCTSLASITIPNSVTSIGRYAFKNCTSFASITIPNSVTSIGGYAFCSCEGLTSISIPNSVTEIGNAAFLYCTGLTSITIPNSITTISSGLFSGCTGLTSITIPNSVKTIESSAFELCDKLSTVVIGNAVQTIEREAFYACHLKTITFADGSVALELPKKLSELIDLNICEAFYMGREIKVQDDAQAFKNIPSQIHTFGIGKYLNQVEVQSGDGVTAVYSFVQKPQRTPATFPNKIYIDATLYVPKGTRADYQTVDGWKEFDNIVEMDTEDMWKVFFNPEPDENTAIHDISYEENNDKNNGVHIQTTGYGVRMLNAQKGDVVSIYTVDGSLVKTVRVESELTDIDLPSDQVYIIKVKDLSVKVRP